MEYRLLYNAAAHFAAAEKYPDGLLNEMSKPGPAGLAALCWAIAELGRQAELARRAMGYDPGDMPEEGTIMARLMPKDILPARKAVLDAMTRGLGDAGTARWTRCFWNCKKKKGARMSRAKYLSLAMGPGFSLREAMLEEIATVLLMAEARAEGRKGSGNVKAEHID